MRTALGAGTALSAATVALACEDRTRSPIDITGPPSFEVVDRGWQPFTWYWWACHEPVTIEGKYHFTAAVEENDNRWHWRWNTNLIGSGVGEYSGSTYRFSEAYNGTENLTPGWVYPLTVSYTDRLRLVGQDPGADLVGTWQWHTTVNANGVTTAVVDSWAFTCEDRGPPPLERTLIVNVTDDVDDGSCTATHCSLREALMASNSRPGTDTIAFRVPGPGPHTIQPGYGLPGVFDAVVIDGTTEPNFAGTPIVELDGSQAGEVNGLMIFAGSSTVRGLVINRFGSAELVNGIELNWNGGNVIEGNYIGTDVTGTVALGNSNAGVMINAPDNLIGGTTAAARNLISGNLEGVTIADPIATGNRIQGNYIGTDGSGTQAVRNTAGLLVLTSGNTIGGALKGTRNVISGNEIGVNIGSGEAAGNAIVGNYIGTDFSGTTDVGNVVGLLLSGPDNVVGGSMEGARNVVSGNESDAIRIEGGDAVDNQILGNLIGTDASGMVALGNGGVGVLIADASNTTVGSRTPGAGNVIAANRVGIVVTGDAHRNAVRGNLIGTDLSGAAALGNNVFGIIMGRGASDNWIGGRRAGSGNVIAFSGVAAVLLRPSAASGNAILGNDVFASGGLGIDLSGDGVTPNDPGDTDTGSNDLQNFPILAWATGPDVTVSGTLNSAPDNEFRIEFFANETCDPSGYGEGETFLGNAMVTTDDDGDASFTVTLGATVPAGAFITATATDPNGSTSEFSACVEHDPGV